MKRYVTLIVLLLAVGITSCEHKDLCYNHREHAHRYHINVVADYRYDWEECLGGPNWLEMWPEHYMPYDDLRPGKPSGLRVVNTNKDGDYNMHNIKPDGGTVTLYEGYNDLLFYNNDTEYIIFSRTGSSATTRATTRTRTRAVECFSDEFANMDDKETSPPDMLYANFIEGYIAEKVVDPVDIEVTLQPLVFAYKIRFEFEAGLKYVASARAELSGMAKEVTLNTGETSAEVVTLVFDCDVTEFGARARVNSFGVPAYPHPNYPTRVDNQHILTLKVTMRNGKMKPFVFDVTDQVRTQPHGGVIVVSGLVIEDEEGTSGSGAFDVEVDDWGPYEDVELPL